MSFDSSCGFLFYHLHYYGGCQYVKGTKQILIAMCVVEITGLHSNFLVCKLQFYTVNFTVCSVNVFTVFLYLLQNYSGNHSCQNYLVKTIEFFYSVVTPAGSENRLSLRVIESLTEPIQSETNCCYMRHVNLMQTTKLWDNLKHLTCFNVIKQSY